MDNDIITLIAGLHRQNESILQELKILRAKVEQLQSTAPDTLNVWVIGYANLRDALSEAGILVGIVKLRTFRSRGVFRVSESEDLECRQIGTEKSPRYRFHVGKCKAAIARFECLPDWEKQRILNPLN